MKNYLIAHRIINKKTKINYAYFCMLYNRALSHCIKTTSSKIVGSKRHDHLKCQFYQRLDSVLDAARSGLLRVNRGADANRLDDLLTSMSNAIREARIYLGCRNLQNSMYQGGMSKQRS